MIKKRILQTQLQRLAKTEAEQLDYDDYLLLGDLIRDLFPAGHPLGAEYADLAARRARRSKKTDEEDAATASHHLIVADQRQMRSMAQSALSLVDKLGVPFAITGDPDEQHIARLVNQTYYHSSLFTWTKVALAFAMLCIGVGSASFLGISINVWSQVRSAYETVATIEKTTNEEMKSAVAAAKGTIESAVRTTTNNVEQVWAKNAERDIQQAVSGATRRITQYETEQLEKLKQRQSMLDQNISGQEKRLTDLTARIAALEQNLSSILAIEVKIASGTASGNLQLIGAVLERAAFCLLLFLALAMISVALSLYCLLRLRRAGQSG